MRLNNTGICKILFAVVAIALIGSACGSDESVSAEPTYTVLSDPALGPGDAVPVPTGDVVLTLGGDISNTNVDGTLQFDIATLESLGLIEYSVDDYQAEGRVVSFSGVLVSDVLEIAGANGDASMLRTIALNDYEVDIPVVDIIDYPVMIATSVDGERMPVDQYGPTRVIYPSSLYDLDAAVYDPRWIWQLSRIEVK